MIYLLDTNTVSDLLAGQSFVLDNLVEAKRNNNIVGLTYPIEYELLWGLYRRNNKQKLKLLQEVLIPKFDYIELEYDDWLQAAQFWADTVKQGRQLSDIDLLLGAMAYKRDATIVTSDNDFNILPIKQVNWRTAS